MSAIELKIELKTSLDELRASRDIARLSLENKDSVDILKKNRENLNISFFTTNCLFIMLHQQFSDSAKINVNIIKEAVNDTLNELDKRIDSY